MAEELKVGDRIPPFYIKDHEGYDVMDEDIIGTAVVIFFYRKNENPGCQEEILAFQGNLNRFDELQTLVLGVSKDDVATHKAFLTKNKLQFSLLSDEKKDMARNFGVLDDKEHIVRTTFVVDSRGIIKWMEKPVKIKDHVERVLKALEEHCKEEVVKFDDFEQDYAEFLEGSLKMDEEEKKIQKQIIKEFGIKKKDLEDKKK